MVFVNGFNLGRYLSAGPGFTLYLPAPLLNTGDNQVRGRRRSDGRGILTPGPDGQITRIFNDFRHKLNVPDPQIVVFEEFASDSLVINFSSEPITTKTADTSTKRSSAVPL